MGRITEERCGNHVCTRRATSATATNEDGTFINVLYENFGGIRLVRLKNDSACR